MALFSFGAGSAGEGSTRLGATLAASAFGLLPFAVTMLQARVFYALTDSRTPTLLQLVIVVVKIPLLLAAPFVLPPQWVVLGLAAANGLSFVVGWVLGQMLLHRRLGPLGTGAVLGVLVRMAVASVLRRRARLRGGAADRPGAARRRPGGGIVDRADDRRGDRRTRRRGGDARAAGTGGGRVAAPRDR